jgi:hypothetical protein
MIPMDCQSEAEGGGIPSPLAFLTAG